MAAGWRDTHDAFARRTEGLSAALVEKRRAREMQLDELRDFKEQCQDVVSNPSLSNYAAMLNQVLAQEYARGLENSATVVNQAAAAHECAARGRGGSRTPPAARQGPAPGDALGGAGRP